jgi:hypothetical protein
MGSQGSVVLVESSIDSYRDAFATYVDFQQQQQSPTDADLMMVPTGIRVKVQYIPSDASGISSRISGRRLKLSVRF